MRTASEELAHFAAALRPDDVPAPVIARVKRHLLDVLGVALAAAPQPFARPALDAATALGGHGDAPVIGFAARLPPAWAAMVNGALAHGLDYDDTHEEAVTHVSCSVAPAMLAAAAGADGPQALAALALGMESAVRLGRAAPGRFHDRGFHPTGICGAYACALVAGTLGGLDAERLTQALGLAGSMAAGTMEFLTDGTWAKRVHPGWAAHAGLAAAALAGSGFTGPRQTLEGRFGLYRSHLGDDDWDLDAVTRGLGQRWHLLDIALKPYPCCHMTHAFIDAAAALRRAPGVHPDEITAIECFIHPREVPVVCEPLASKRLPQTDYDAKFSLPYAVASILVRGHLDVDDFTSAAIRDPAVLALAQRVSYSDDPDSDFPASFPGAVRIHLRNGQVVEHREAINRGSAEKPLTRDEVGAKFRRNATRVMPPAAVEALVGAVETLAGEPTLSQLVRGLQS